jgi:hypothetical protein
MGLETHLRLRSADGATTADGRPVLLATVGVPLDRTGAIFAVDSAVEQGRSLILVNVTRLEPLSLSVRMGYDALEEFTPEVTASMRWCADLARSLGLRVDRLRIRSPRPVTALIEFSGERRAGILVFAPDRTALGERSYRRTFRRLVDVCPCLLWTASHP